MYDAILTLHSLLRWALLALALAAVVRAWWGWLGAQPWTRGQQRLNTVFVIFMDVQLVLGLWLYAVLSPITQAAFQDFGGAMRDGYARYWAVEHLAIMLVALVLVHLGHALSRRAPLDPARHRRAALFFTVAILGMVAGIPWPGLEAGRPLLRFF